MDSAPLLDRAGRCRSPATLPAFHQGRPPRNKGLRYPADPPTVEEIIAVMPAAGDDADGIRLRGMIVVLWRAGLRISEALAPTESDLDRTRGAVLVRHGNGRICRKQHMPPMLRAVECGAVCGRSGLSGATYFGRDEARWWSCLPAVRAAPVVPAMHRGVSSWYDRSYAVATASATNAAIAAVNSRLLSSQA